MRFTNYETINWWLEDSQYLEVARSMICLGAEYGLKPVGIWLSEARSQSSRTLVGLITIETKVEKWGEGAKDPRRAEVMKKIDAAVVLHQSNKFLSPPIFRRK